MITVHDVEQGTPEWLELRKDRYTGQHAHKLLKHTGAVKIVHGVASAYALNEIAGFTGNFYTRRGHVLEDEVIKLYERIYKTTVDTFGFITNDKYPTSGYSPDGVDGDILLECKAFNIAKQTKIVTNYRRAGVFGIPIEILAQIHFGLTITELKQARLLLYNPDMANAKDMLVIIDIKADPKITKNFKRLLLPQPVGAK